MRRPSPPPIRRPRGPPRIRCAPGSTPPSRWHPGRHLTGPIRRAHRPSIGRSPTSASTADGGHDRARTIAQERLRDKVAYGPRLACPGPVGATRASPPGPATPVPGAIAESTISVHRMPHGSTTIRRSHPVRRDDGSASTTGWCPDHASPTLICRSRVNGWRGASVAPARRDRGAASNGGRRTRRPYRSGLWTGAAR
jgi:hypothetical protein